jgi:hypothetical protein
LQDARREYDEGSRLFTAPGSHESGCWFRGAFRFSRSNHMPATARRSGTALSSAPAVAAAARPMPPAVLLATSLVELEALDLGTTDDGDLAGQFVPASDVVAWIRATFLDEASPLYNPDHAHIVHAILGVVWTNVAYVRQGRTVLGTAEMPSFQ